MSKQHMLTNLFPICFSFQPFTFNQLLAFVTCVPRQFSRLAVEFERGYLGDDGNAKTLHIGTSDFDDENDPPSHQAQSDIKHS